MPTQDRLTYLLMQALDHSASEAELLELSTLIRKDESGDVTRQLEQLLLQQLQDKTVTDYDPAYWDGIVSDILSADKPLPGTAFASPAPVALAPKRRIWWMPAAAAVLLLAISLYLFRHKPDNQPVIAKTDTLQDIAPGTTRAVLTLADGTEIEIDTTANTALSVQGNTSISQIAGGRLLYHDHKGREQTPSLTQYNTLRTPRGGQFRITLPDGTNVWLNAASSLKYPVAFKGAERRVELTGEAYFEVARKAHMPFHVTIRTGQLQDSMQVAVLGTQFNVMAYADEQIVKTTLLEGAVKVISNHSSKQLTPGQGAILNKQDQTFTLQQTDTEEAVAWKNGFIQLEGNDLRSIMRMITRWYDVEVIFADEVPGHFRGAIPKNVPVSQVLKMMEMTGEVHFDIKGKQIIVSR
ncbi:FecR family protein [Chitinophaga rhizophila]|uniref:FecR domain-containing protein n=1 Tax=Chitinophaga rhizophila TaxID=2866212 RepID=A0ABS7G7R8_9BACT|nr:FecR family protein [Chitinophaga rhizophila]MBW8682844.1 FecR domain-containing protein [Chitinophaga rhizophila]